MSHYSPGRQKIQDTFWTEFDSGKTKVACTIFEHWEFKISGVCYCGTETPVTYSRSGGISRKSSTTSESAIEGSIGPLGLVQLKGAIKESFGYEVSWSENETQQFSSPCKPPKCGRSETTIYQLIREFEIDVYRRGSWPFRDDVWDKKRSHCISEEIQTYAAVPDDVEWDERCKCDLKASPDFDGRLSIDLRSLSLLVPYKLTHDGIQIRISNLVISFPFYDYPAAVRALDRGLNLPMERRFFSPVLLFFGGLEGETFEGNARIYRDHGIAPPEIPSHVISAQPVIHDIWKLSEKDIGDELKTTS